MAQEKVRFGIIGVGGMGSGHCNILPKIPEAELTAICDIDAETRERITAQHHVPGFATHQELLQSDLVDAVIIATPHYFHPPIAIDAFQAGKHVMSEKPLGVTVSAVDSMIAAAKKSGKKFGVMYQMRSESKYAAAREIVQSGVLGEIYRTSLIMGWYRSQAYYNSGGWRATWSGEGGGVLINQAPHALDLFAWLGGLPSRITGTTRTRLHDIEVEDEAFATLEYANGAHGYLYASTTEEPGTQRFEICGDRGKLMIDDAGIRLQKLDGSIKEFTQSSPDMWGGPKSSNVEVALQPEPTIPGHGAITQNFCRSILNGEKLIAPGEDGINAVELINGIILSSKRCRPVNVPVDRAEYNSLIEELKASSRAKSTVKTQRVTDPKFA